MGKIPLLLILICLASKAFAGIMPTPVSIEDIAIEALMNNNSGIVPASAKATLSHEGNGFPVEEDELMENKIFQKELMAQMKYFKKKYPHMKLYKYREKNGRWVLTDNLGVSK